MKRKLIAFLTAMISVIGCTSLSFPVSAGAILQDDEIIEDTTEVTTTPTTSNNITEEEFNQRSEQLQEQINEIYRLFEENGYNIEGITGDVEGLNGEVQGLHTSLDNLYSLIESLKTTNRSSSAAPIASPQTTPPKKEPSTVTTEAATIHAEPNTEPNGYLVEKAEKTPEKRDFITVTTRDGHIFYIVIDYEGENKNVYFLNTVDTADLKRLLESDSTAKVEETSPKNESETKTEAVKSVKETDNGETTKKKNSNLILYIIGVISVVVFVFIAKKKISKSKKNDYDDEIDSDDFSEEEPEIYIDESKEDDDE